ncbi:MAG: hypothetical protein HYY25_11700 [Candidatus Wallbacteria bacterium]|nr:hypothetical protein [Candidatus Wallbacteria bacterium]
MRSRLGSALVVSVWLAAALAPPAAASHRVRLLGAGDERGLDTFRAVSKITRKEGPVFVDKSQDGLRVGQLTPDNGGFGRAERTAAPRIDPEERIAVVRPVFSEPIAAVRGWRVVSVVQRTFTQGTTLFGVRDSWGAATGAKEMFEILKDAEPITPTSLVDLFQRVLDGGNNSSVTNGLYLAGSGTLRVPATQPLFFDVFLEAPLPVGTTPDDPVSTHPIIPVTAAAEVRNVVIGNDGAGNPVTQRFNFLAFSAGFKGFATIFVSETGGALRPIQTGLGVAPGVVYRTAIRNESLAAGANQVLVGVTDRDDPDLPAAQAARGFSAPVTMNNPP